MITYSKEKTRHVFKMSSNDLSDFAELIYLLKHTPPPIGYNRKPMTIGQQKIVDSFHTIINFPDGYRQYLNDRTDQ